MDIYPAADTRSVRPGTVFHYKICRCITLPDGRSIHGTLAIVRRGQWGTPLAGSHRNLPFVSLLSLFFMNTRQETALHDEETGIPESKRERRDSTISFRVSRTQREHIGRLADRCGMTISDYVLARSYNYRPKERMTPRQELIRDELIIARSDYARYTSMLNAMPQDERRTMFRNQTWMVGALQLLGRTAEAITKIIDRHFAPNRIPESPPIQEQTETKEKT